MITATQNYKNTLAAFENGKIVYYIKIDGYSRSFTNSPALAASLPGTSSVQQEVLTQEVTQEVPSPSPAGYDMLEWMMMSPTLRAAYHLEGTKLNGVTASNHIFTYLGTGRFNWIKGDSGYPSDEQIFDDDFIYLSTTEDSDGTGGGYGDPHQGKRFESLNPTIGFKGVPFAKRLMNIGDSVYSSDSRLAIYTACGVATYTDIGYVKVTLVGPTPFTPGGAGANLPANMTSISLQYEWSLDSSYSRKSGTTMETFTFCQPYGLVHWQTQNWNVSTNSYDAPNNGVSYSILVSGLKGSAVPDDPCGFGVDGGGSPTLPVVLTEVLTEEQETVSVSTITPVCFPWLVSIDDLDINVNDMDGGSDVVNLCFTVQDFNNLITKDFPNFIFEGSVITLMSGFEGMGLADFCTLFQGFIDTVASANSNSEYYFSCVDVSAKLQQVVYQIADDGAPTNSNNLKTLSAHPLDILLDICNSQIVNADGSIGLPAGFLDTAKIEAYRDGPFSGVQFVFHLTAGPSALDFIKNQLLKPLGGYLWVNSAGTLTVNFFYPLAGPTAVQTLGPDSWLTIPEAEQTDMINTVQMSFDKDDATPNATGNYLSNSTNEYGASVVKYGLYGEQSINADGVRSAFQGFFIAALTSRLIFMRYGFKNLMFDQNAAESLWNTALLESGDVIAVTHPQIPDRQNGVMGITNRLFEILHRHINFTEGKITLTMIDASYLSTFGFAQIAPDGEPAYPLADSQDRSQYMFLANDNEEYSPGQPANVLG
jgi:hypothetical protein